MNTSRYVIEGGLVYRETIGRTDMAPLEEVFNQLTSYQPLELGHVPHGLKAIKVTPRPNMQLAAKILVGHDPVTRRITHKACGASSSSRPSISYNLNLPYGLFWFEIEGNRINELRGSEIIWTPRGWGYLWQKAPYTGNDQETWTAGVPNIYSDSRICFGSASIPGSQALGHYIDQAINTFWTSEFNEDLQNARPFANLRDWEAARDNDWREWTYWNTRTRAPLRQRLSQFDGLDFDWDLPVTPTDGTPIPALPMAPTFYNLENWVSGLDTRNKQRLLQVLNGTPLDPEESTNE